MDAPFSRDFTRSASLWGLFVAWSYSAYTYLSGDFGNLGFVLRLIKHPMAYAWPMLGVVFVLQLLTVLGALLVWKRSRALRGLSLFSIGLAVWIQTLLLASCVALEFAENVNPRGLILPLAVLIEMLLMACLAWLLVRTKKEVGKWSVNA